VARETSGPAITALVFAVLGWTFFPLFGSIAALIYAGQAEREIMAQADDLAGVELVGAARNIAVVNLLLWLLAVALIVVLAVTGTLWA